MKRSMTAYGRGQKTTSSARWTVEISSLNQKGLDLHINLPPSLLFLDPTLRKWAAEIASRGQLSIRISCEIYDSKSTLQLLKDQKSKWIKVAKALGYPESCVDFQFLTQQSALQHESFDEKSTLRDLKPVWQAACKAWIAMKEKEGSVLVQEIQKRLQIIVKQLKTIEKMQPLLQEKYRARLQERMSELNLSLDEDKIVREAALFVEKSDITEEITRLYSHEEQMKEYLSSKELSVGRTLDFLAQEMGREISTLMAKAGDSAIAKIAVVIKSEIEKIREQVQNIE